MSVSSPDIDTECTRVLRERMATELIDSGAITDDAWRHAFTAVPRHVLVPRFYRTNDRAVIDSTNPGDQTTWREAVYSNKTLLTQITPTEVTSSATMPGLLAKMLTALRINPGDFENTPREVFVPRFYRWSESGQKVLVNGTDSAQREQWLHGVYTDDALTV